MNYFLRLHSCPQSLQINGTYFGILLWNRKWVFSRKYGQYLRLKLLDIWKISLSPSIIIITMLLYLSHTIKFILLSGFNGWIILFSLKFSEIKCYFKFHCRMVYFSVCSFSFLLFFFFYFIVCKNWAFVAKFQYVQVQSTTLCF